MRSIERYRLIESIARFLAPKPRAEVVAIFLATRVKSSPGSAWDEWGEDNKIASVRIYLRDVPDEVVESLQEFLPREQDRDAFSVLDDALAEYDKPQKTSVARLPTEVSHVMDGPIFVVHGHAHAVLHEAVRVLERGTGREVTVLHEQPNAGRTILEKFEDHAVTAAFAVVLLTGDDAGGVSAGADIRLRGRQNVIFELGFFFGKLGRQRVAVLLEEGIEKPSDIDGLVYINLDSASAWKYVLARELEAADISVDRSRIPT
jgi:predicted nucleotide-binding protein